MRRAMDYFALTVEFKNRQALTDAKTPLIFALEPHDVLPVSMGAFHFSLDWIPGHKCAGLVTSAVFALPGMKSIYSILSARSVDRETFSRLLKAGRSCCFCPGGVQEVMHLRRSDEVVLFLNARLGFARLALRHKTPVVPCFTFGLSKTYSHLFMRGRLAERIARAIGFLPGVFWGLWNIPFGPPRSSKLAVVVGEPIPMPSDLLDGEPSNEAILAYHAQFIQAMTALYEKHKAEHGMEHVTLRII